MIVIAGIVGLINTIMLISHIWRHGSRQLARGLLLSMVSLTIYVLEIWWGTDLVRHTNNIAALNNVIYLLLGGSMQSGFAGPGNWSVGAIMA